jgi:hypothetical protein
MSDEKIIIPEVVGPDPSRTESSTPPAPEGPMIHPIAAAALIVVDSLWTIPEIAGFVIPVILAGFLSVGPLTFLVQKFIRGDSNGRAAAIALFLAILAAVPTPVVGTTVGLIVLGMAGLHHFKLGSFLGLGKGK